MLSVESFIFVLLCIRAGLHIILLFVCWVRTMLVCSNGSLLPVPGRNRTSNEGWLQYTTDEGVVAICYQRGMDAIYYQRGYGCNTLPTRGWLQYTTNAGLVASTRGRQGGDSRRQIDIQTWKYIYAYVERQKDIKEIY